MEPPTAEEPDSLAGKPSGVKAEEKTFVLDSAEVRRQKEELGEAKWETDGTVELPRSQGFTKLVIEAEAALAEEIQWLRLKGNPVMILEGAEDLFAHPLDLRLGELDHVVRDIVQKREGKFRETRLLTAPQLIQQLCQFKNAP